MVKTGASHAPIGSSTLPRVTTKKVNLVIRFEGSFNTVTGVVNAQDPPVPISNTEVKLSRAEDTWLETAWENR